MLQLLLVNCRPVYLMFNPGWTILDWNSIQIKQSLFYWDPNINVKFYQNFFLLKFLEMKSLLLKLLRIWEFISMLISHFLDMFPTSAVVVTIIWETLAEFADISQSQQQQFWLMPWSAAALTTVIPFSMGLKSMISKGSRCFKTYFVALSCLKNAQLIFPTLPQVSKNSTGCQ